MRNRLLQVIAAVAAVMGARGVLKGPAELIGAPSAPAEVDNEYRFYAAWYHVFGLLLLRAVRRGDDDPVLTRAFGYGFLVAACGRARSRVVKGRPHPVQNGLMAIEFGLAALFLWPKDGG